MALQLLHRSPLLAHMSSFMGGSGFQDDFKVIPAIPSRYSIYNVYSGMLQKNTAGFNVLNGGIFPRLANIIGESATGKTSLLVSLATGAIDYIYDNYGNSCGSALMYFDVEHNLNPKRFCDLSNWSELEFETKCAYTTRDISLLDLANLIIKIATEKKKYRKDYTLRSGLLDTDGREVTFLAPTFICVDSVAQVNPNGIENLVEFDKAGETKDVQSLGSNMEGATDAKAWTVFVRKIKPFLDEGNIGLFCINHKTKEIQTSMYEKPTRYLPFLGMGEKVKGGKEFIFQSYNILHLNSGEKLDEKNPIYGSDIFGFTTRASFVKNKANVEGKQFPMVFDQRKGYVPELSDLEYMWQRKYGFDGTVKISLDVLPEVGFTRKTFLDVAEEYPQVLRALQFTAKYVSSCEMLYGINPLPSLKQFGENIPLEQRLAILYNFTTPYRKGVKNDKPYQNFVQLAHENRHYFDFGMTGQAFNTVVPTNDNIELATEGFTFIPSKDVSPFDVDAGTANIIDGKYIDPYPEKFEDDDLIA